MKHVMPKTMKAVALDSFGGIENMRLQTLDVPELGPGEILIRVESAGVGVWDPFEIEGGFAKMFGIEPKFPYVPGSDGAGTVEAVGDQVDQFKEGDRVYGISLASPKGGFYAEYTVVKTENASHIPDNLTIEQAGVLPVDAITALEGLDDTLGLKTGESLIIVGASGGIGHLAVQLAKRMGARVLAVASGKDGLELVKGLGADMAIDGHRDDVMEAAQSLRPTVCTLPCLRQAARRHRRPLACLRKGGRAAYPNGVEPEPTAPAGVDIKSYDGMPNRKVFDKLNHMIESGPFEVHIARTFTLDQAVEAHRALKTHFLGKLGIIP